MTSDESRRTMARRFGTDPKTWRRAVGERTLEVRTLPGHGPVLVFLHEGLGCVELWRRTPERLCAATGCAGIIYSRAGYGRSDPHPPPWPQSYLHDEVPVLVDLLDAFEVEQTVLVGHSDGASISLLAARPLGSRLLAMVLEAPHVFVEDVNLQAIAAAVSRYRTEGLRERLGRYHDHVDQIFEGWSGAWLGFENWDLRAEFAGVETPTLLVQGSADPYGGLLQLDAIEEHLAGRVERLVIDGVGHAPHQEAPEAVLAAAGAFVGELGRC